MRHRLTIALLAITAGVPLLASPGGAGPLPVADGLIARAGSPPKGDDTYNETGGGQTVREKIRRGKTDALRWIVENDGDAGDLTLDGPGTSNCFGVRYEDQFGMNVTGDVVAGTFVASLDPEERARFKVKVKARGCPAGSRRTLNFDVAPDVGPTDRVRAKVKITVPPPPPPPPCDPNYAGACIPPFPPDIDCTQIPDRNFASVGSDPHNLDGDNDGVACET